MKQKRNSHRISRMKVPNLKEYVSKIDTQQYKGVKFFTKIDNSFRLLEQQIGNYGQMGLIGNDVQNQLPIIKRRQMNPRLAALAHHKGRSSSMPRDLENKKINQVNKSMDNMKNKSKIGWRNRTYSVKSTNNMSFSEQSGSITGCKLVSVPIGKILALKQKMEMVKQKNNDTHSDSEQDHQDHHHNHPQSTDKNEQKLVICKNQDFITSFDKIVDGQNYLYDRYDKKLMEKIRLYRSRQFKLDYQNSWK